MKYAMTVILAAALVVAACAPKAEKVALKEGTPAYALAQELAKTMPALGPDKTTVIAEAKGIAVTAAEVIRTMWDNMGSRVDALKTVDAGKLKEIFERGATQIVERKLLLAAATAAKTVVPPSELDQAMASEYAQAGGEENFRKVIGEAGVSIDHVKTSVGETLLINKLLGGIADQGPKVTEEDLRKAYQDETSAGEKTATVRHILLMTQGKTDAEKAEVRKKI
jgi:hypothetical protein